MATTVASRFAVLSLDEDDDYSSRKKKCTSKKIAESAPQNATAIKSETNFKKKKKNNSNNTNGNNSNGQGQNAKSKNKPSSGGNSKKKKDVSDLQWEEWKQKDVQFVEGNYEDELSQAILLSKLDYEEKKHIYESSRKAEEQKKNLKKNKKNQKPSALDCNKLESEINIDKLSTGNSPKCKTDLQQIDKVSKAEKTKDLSFSKEKSREDFNEEALTLAQYEDRLEKRDREITELKDVIDKLRDQLHNVKSRNKKLCEIIANGEMKDKAIVLMEVDRLQSVKDELSSEVVRLHEQLEQERSKVRSLTGNDHRSKDKNKKRIVSE